MKRIPVLLSMMSIIGISILFIVIPLSKSWLFSRHGVKLPSRQTLAAVQTSNKFWQITSEPLPFAYIESSQIFTGEHFTWFLPFINPSFNQVSIPLRLSTLESQLLQNDKDKQQLMPRRLIEVAHAEKELTDPKAISLQYDLYEQALTVIINKGKLIPFQQLDTLTFASLAIGQSGENDFQFYLNKYAPFQHFAISGTHTTAHAYDGLINQLQNFKVVVISLHHVYPDPLQSYGISQSTRTLIERLRSKTKVILAVFGTPYSLKYFDRMDYLLCAYENNSITQKLVPQVLFGAIPAVGRLPVTVTSNLKAGSGLSTPSLNRLGYSIPERVGLHSTVLQQIDQLVEGYIGEKVMPGAQVLVAKKGKVVFEKAYGYLTYEKQIPVTTHTLYDLASVTKVAASLQAIMMLHAQGKLDINLKASDYLPELKHTNKEGIIIRDLLLHQAGLLTFQDHWRKTKTVSGLDTNFYKANPDARYSLEVATGLYGLTTLKDSLWQWTIQSRLLRKAHSQKQYPYKYSDIGFDILQQLVERLVEQSMDEYLDKNIYKPLGLDELTFNPLHKFEKKQIAPTEKDDRFREMLLQGTVHDQQAALMGGVAGHAGLFGTANDLAVLMQMNLQKGYYGGKQFMAAQTIPIFTKTYRENNPRALGWDRLQVKGEVSALASAESFGHTGFTGTCVWVDPEEELIYIFLSNRVYPTVDNTKLARYKVREKVQQRVYESMTTTENVVTALNDK